MGDGTIAKQKRHYNPYLQVIMIKQEYLNYLYKIFGKFSNGVKFWKSAKEAAEEASKTGFSENAQEINYEDQYIFRTISHPELERFNEWYSSGEKTFPKNIKLTPTVLKHWYCCDGYFDNSSNQRITISVANEVENKDKLLKMFRESGLPSPKFRKCRRKDGYVGCRLEFLKSDSLKIWEYMGDPLPGFEYKWPGRFINTKE